MLTDLIFLFLGWSFLFFLSNRNFKLAEISRSKDKLVDELSDLYQWFEIKSNENDISVSFFESLYISHVVRIEFKVYQFNRYAGITLINPEDHLYLLRNLDFNNQSADEGEKLLRTLNNIVADFIEDIEKSYDGYLIISSNFFKSLWINNRYHLMGAFFASVIVYLLFKSVATLMCVL